MSPWSLDLEKLETPLEVRKNACNSLELNAKFNPLRSCKYVHCNVFGSNETLNRTLHMIIQHDGGDTVVYPPTLSN